MQYSHSLSQKCIEIPRNSQLAFLFAAVCSAGGLRLVSKTGKIKRVTSGRLEVHMNGEWGTVCFRNFEKNDAIFACKEMGFKEESPHYSQISSAELVYEIVDQEFEIGISC